VWPEEMTGGCVQIHYSLKMVLSVHNPVIELECCVCVVAKELLCCFKFKSAA